MSSAIRLARVEDAEQIAAIYAPFVRDSPVSFETMTPDAVEIGRRIADTLAALPYLVCDAGGGVVAGYAYASPHRARAAYRWAVDVSVYVAADHRRSGVGRALYASLFRVLTAQGFYAACAGITLPNDASVALHESMGFALVGVYPAIGYKMGRWHDVGWWQMPLKTRAGDDPPAEPTALPALMASSEWTGF